MASLVTKIQSPKRSFVKITMPWYRLALFHCRIYIPKPTANKNEREEKKGPRIEYLLSTSYFHSYSCGCVYVCLWLATHEAWLFNQTKRKRALSSLSIDLRFRNEATKNMKNFCITVCIDDTCELSWIKSRGCSSHWLLMFIKEKTRMYVVAGWQTWTTNMYFLSPFCFYFKCNIFACTTFFVAFLFVLKRNTDTSHRANEKQQFYALFWVNFVLLFTINIFYDVDIVFPSAFRFSRRTFFFWCFQ